MEADDLLLSQVSKFSATPPNFDPADVHIVMWERQTPSASLLPLRGPGVNPEPMMSGISNGAIPNISIGAAQRATVAGQICTNGNSNGSHMEGDNASGSYINGGVVSSDGSVVGNKSVCHQNGTTLSFTSDKNGTSALQQNGTLAVHQNGTSVVHQNGTPSVHQNGTLAVQQVNAPTGCENGTPAGGGMSAAAERLARMRSKYAAEPPPSVVARRGPSHLSFAPPAVCSMAQHAAQVSEPHAWPE